MFKLDPETLSKAGTAFASFCGAIYFVWPGPSQDTAHASTLFIGACALTSWVFAGNKASAERAEIKSSQAELAAVAESVKADTVDMRNSPNMPGTPVAHDRGTPK